MKISQKLKLIEAAFIVLLIISPVLLAAPMGVSIDNRLENIKITPYLHLLEDPSRNLTIEQIVTPEYLQQFRENKFNKEGFSYTKSAYWAYFDLNMNSEAQWYLLFELRSTVVFTI